MKRILIIDDDHDIIALLKRFLTKHGFEIETAFSGAQGEKLADSFNPDLVMCDYRLDDMDGTILLGRIKERNPDLPVIIMTGYSDLRTAIKVVRLGAFDYITKPFVPDEILLTINQALSNKTQPVRSGKTKSENTYLFSDSIHSKHLAQQIELVAPTNYSVIIHGESGVGKEGVARMIHDKSNRSTSPFVAMDCGAISKELAGSELFGHEKGSFTGALNQKLGHFEMAEGGTLFLDEVANLPYEVQMLLLRVLQEKMLRRIGNTKETKTDVRIIVASNEKLTESIKQGKFREDLYHRLNEFTIDVLPLRKRKDDIIFFALNFLHQTARELNKTIDGLDAEVQNVFINYSWPGNIRELKNVIKRAALLCTKSQLDVRSLPFEILNHQQIDFEPEETGVTESVEPVHHSATPPVAEEFSKPQLKKAALTAEYDMIMHALTKANFNKSKAAIILGIDRKTLYNKMKQMK